ncbi:MAG: FAD-dependent oxidoreductase [Burkholderiales bacterium RIFCSPLOWO2_12_FULL_61_40]|nr:MAG: FAD-dependent oxidoreductase [Burkholderiales bacterium RIFCSPLOWO2_12_FULL_61_40]
MHPLSRRKAMQTVGLAALAPALGAVAAPHAMAAVPVPGALPRGVAWHNWSGCSGGQAASLQTPADVAAVQQLLRSSSGPVRCVGAGHSFSALVPTEGSIVSLDRLAGLIGHDKVAATATFHAGTRLAQLSRQLDQVGLALRNLPDIDAQSFAGAISTATHGTGANLPALHDDVQSLQWVRPNGELLECSKTRQADMFAALKVSLGSLGILTQATSTVLPAYNLKRKVWLKPVEELLQMTPELARQHRHFEFYYLPFTGYAAAITHDLHAGSDVLRPDSADEEMLRDLRHLRDWLGRFPDLRRWVAQKLIDPAQTELAQDRSWKLLSTQRPTKFNESECHVPRELGVDCVREVIRTLELRNDVFFPMEFRFVKGDDAWLSPFYQQDSCSIAVHAAAGEAYDYLVSDIAPVFRKFNGRPHWGKLHGHTAADLPALYPRWKDFLQVRAELDPTGRMLNPHLRSLFGIPARA